VNDHAKVGFLILTAALCGFGSSLLWTAQGKYISECATSETQGLFFAIFGSFFMSSMIVGTLLGSYVISNLPLTYFFKLLTVICAVGTLFFLILPLPIKEDNFVNSDQL